MRPRPDHPLLAGCRLLWLPLGRARNRNFGRGGGGGASALTATGSTHRDRVPRLVFTSGGSDGVNLPSPTALGMAGTRMTVIARLRTADAATGSLYDIVKSFDAGPNAGFSLFLVRSGFTNIGMNLAVYSGGNAWVRYVSNGTLGNPNGRDMTVAGVFDNTTASGARFLKIYIDGRRLDDADSGVSGAGSSWNVAASDPIGVGHTYGGGDELDGEVGYVALFDRVLSDAEILRWSQVSKLDFLDEEDQVVTTGANSYGSLLGLASVLATQVAGNSRFAAALEAGFSVGGDLTVEPASPAAFASQLGLRAVAQTGIPLLARYKSILGLSSLATASAPHSFTGRLGAKAAWRGLPDGRVNLLGSTRYRR